MARAKKEKKETYYQRWLRGKKRMLLIMKEEEFNAVKAFCDAHQMSYREFFVNVAPKLLTENEELKKNLEEVKKALAEKEAEVGELREALAKKEAELKDLSEKHGSLVEKCRALNEKHKALSEDYSSLSEAYEALKEKLAEAEAELNEKESELQEVKKVLSDLQARLKSAEAEAKELKEVLGIITREGEVELPVEFCDRLKKYGFHTEEKEVSSGLGGLIKKTVSVCTNA